MMLKIILCGYTQSVFSGHRIEDLTKDSIRMMWLAQEYEPSYRTINRFRIHPQMQELLRQCFVQFRCQLIEENYFNLGFTRFSVRGKAKVKNEIGLALMATNLRKYTVQRF